jgi:hypothetical protein
MYRKEIVQHFNKFDFNYFFTGTFDPNSFERKKIKRYNDKIKQLNETIHTDLSYRDEKRIGIKSLKEYTERFIQFLLDKGWIERCFVVFEMGNNDKYHIHILFGTNNDKNGFKDYLQNYWLLGKSLTLPIDTEKDKYNYLSYVVKELKPSSHKIKDLNKIDNWFFDGDFRIKKNIKTPLIKPNSKPIIKNLNTGNSNLTIRKVKKYRNPQTQSFKNKIVRKKEMELVEL